MLLTHVNFEAQVPTHMLAAGSKAAKMELYRVPAHASWFKYDAIHSLEVKGCPAFFGTAPGAKRDPKVGFQAS